METIIQKTLKLLLDKFEATYSVVTVTEENGHYRANIETDNAARLIGRNGQSLNALQILLKNILWSQNEEKIFVTVDVDNYRQDQESKVMQKVERTLELMRERNLSEIKLNPMSPYFRRLVHVWIANNFPEMTTDSIGEGEQRAVKVFYK
ncbi:KH domain-containing protein [bacterium]|jgi:spoIIIJ-associated protein|nr:KH domain-containing protein [bacterium]MBT6832089.1 KH domain-containing protein [bacterium]MBT6995870.1 KH domain-containing protein [bacterium]MBT7772605.1 KH domain-containing protein [bacterium]